MKVVRDAKTGESGRRSSRSSIRAVKWKRRKLTLFLALFISPRFFPLLSDFLIEGVFKWKKLICESWWECPKASVWTLSRPRQPFWSFEVLIGGIIKSKTFFREYWAKGSKIELTIWRPSFSMYFSYLSFSLPKSF